MRVDPESQPRINCDAYDWKQIKFIQGCACYTSLISGTEPQFMWNLGDNVVTEQESQHG